MDYCPGFVCDVGWFHAWLVLAIGSLFVVFDRVVDLLVWHLATSKTVGSAWPKPMNAVHETDQPSGASGLENRWLENC